MEQVRKVITCQLCITLLILHYTSVSSEFIPSANQVCQGDSITFNCELIGEFATVQTFLINTTSVNLFQLNNLDSFSGIDLTRLSATVDNTLDQSTGSYTTLRASITLINVTSEDNGTLLGCTALHAVTGSVEKSDTLILASPPSQPTIQLTPMNSMCRVRLQWSYPVQSTLPLTQQITDSVNNDRVTVQNANYLSNPLTAGEDISYTLSAVNCFGDSVTAVSEVFSPPSQPESYSCTADYGTENGMLVLQIDSNSNYATQTGFVITDDTDNVMILSGDFIDNPSYYSQDMIEFNSTRNYSVLFTSVLRDCIGSMSTLCQVKLNITAVVTTTPPYTVLVTTTTSFVSVPNTYSLEIFNSMFWICISASILLCFLYIMVVISFLIFCLNRY